jgi:hypothetical protein
MDPVGAAARFEADFYLPVGSNCRIWVQSWSNKNSREFILIEASLC